MYATFNPSPQSVANAVAREQTRGNGFVSDVGVALVQSSMVLLEQASGTSS
jgi:hypothetical protein